MTFRQFAVDTAEYRDALQLREEILRKPLGLTFTQAELALEPTCFHLGGFDGTKLVAVLLLQPVDEHTIQMRQVAVCSGLQGTGVGMQLIAFAEEFARQKGYRTLIAHARSTALGFYLRLGYTAGGHEFIEQTIPHRLVTKTL
jgi:GNAT superfamily N-acetyltransferase